LFRRFIEIRICGGQPAPDVFWLNLESVFGFINSYIVEKQLHQRYETRGKKQELLLPVATDHRGLVQGREKPVFLSKETPTWVFLFC